MTDGESVEIVLQTWEWFMIGALSSIAAFFFIFYFSKRDEKQVLYFAVGCLITIIRIVFFVAVKATDSAAESFQLIAQINYLSFIWGPFLYAILAESLFPSVGIRYIRRIFLGIAAVISGCILLIPQYGMYYGVAYDFIIFLFVLYAVYIYALAVIRKLQFSIPIFLGQSCICRRFDARCAAGIEYHCGLEWRDIPICVVIVCGGHGHGACLSLYAGRKEPLENAA